MKKIQLILSLFVLAIFTNCSKSEDDLDLNTLVHRPIYPLW